MSKPSKKNILIVDDDEDICLLLSDALTVKGYNTFVAENGKQAWSFLDDKTIDLVLMDLYLNNEDGLQLARQIRDKHAVAIMMLTGKGDETDRILGLELAADDYMMKPFNVRELTARVHALIRRSSQHVPQFPNLVADDHECLSFGKWVIDLTARRLFDADGHEENLTTGEFSLLAVLVKHPDRVLSREQIIDMSRGLDVEVFDRTVDVLILRLRRKIEINPKTPEFIKTQRGIGYIFHGPVHSN